jgi:hypothetical protein
MKFADYDDPECGGCDSCIETVATSRVVIARAPRSAAGAARRARSGIRPGDTITVTSGFDYQRGGGRIGYFRSEELSERGPAWSPEEREFFPLNRETSRRPQDVERLREFLEKGREFEERTSLSLRWFHGSRARAEQEVADHDARARVEARDRAEWAEVTAAQAGAEVSFRGIRYAKGEWWAEAVHHSTSEHLGHLCDATVVRRYRLVPVEGGAVPALTVQNNRMPRRGAVQRARFRDEIVA